MADWVAYGKLISLKEQPGSAVKRTAMESGPPKQAQVLSRVMVTRPVAYLFTAAEYATWKLWFRDSINRGASWFNWTDPTDGVSKSAHIVDGIYEGDPDDAGDGAPMNWIVRFNLETWE